MRNSGGLLRPRACRKAPRRARELHEVEVANLDVLDLRSAEALAEVGLSMNHIESPDWHPCQAVGEAAHLIGAQGLMAPSATRLGFVIAVFEPHLRSGQIRLVATRPF